MALELAERVLPQLVVLDIGFPDLMFMRWLSGFERRRGARTLYWLPRPVGAREDDKQRAFAAGFNHRLTKAIAGEEILTLPRSLSEPGRIRPL